MVDTTVLLMYALGAASLVFSLVHYRMKNNNKHNSTSRLT
jgi:hypothetical protein